MADVFVFYKRAERPRVEQLAERLREVGLDVWFDARLDVGSGEGFDAEIEREVTSAACVVVCWTPEALKSIYVRACVEASRADAAQRRAQSRAAYARIADQIFPGTLAELARRIAAIRERDAEEYHADILAVLAWLESIAEKEARHTAYGYELAERQSGGDAWRWWDRGGAAARGAEIAAVRAVPGRIDDAFARSQALLDRPAP